MSTNKANGSTYDRNRKLYSTLLNEKCSTANHTKFRKDQDFFLEQHKSNREKIKVLKVQKLYRANWSQFYYLFRRVSKQFSNF